MENSEAASASAGRQNQIYHNAGFLWCFVGNVVCVVSRNSGAGKLNMNYTDDQLKSPLVTHILQKKQLLATKGNMNYTDNQLKAALAKMLPDKLKFVPYGRKEKRIRWILQESSEPVRDTELLHLCWLVEETLTSNEVADYTEIFCNFEAPNKGKLVECMSFHASWQQRVEALAKVKGIKI